MTAKRAAIWAAMGGALLAAARVTQIAAASVDRSPQAGEAYLVLSNGTHTCGEYIRASSNNRIIYDSWALGFISGVNWISTGNRRLIGEGWKQEAIGVWLENYCRENPLKPFVVATEGLREALAKEQGIELTPHPEPPAPRRASP